MSDLQKLKDELSSLIAENSKLIKQIEELDNQEKDTNELNTELNKKIKRSFEILKELESDNILKSQNQASSSSQNQISQIIAYFDWLNPFSHINRFNLHTKTYKQNAPI
jgi:chromosome segregation ATPase